MHKDAKGRHEQINLTHWLTYNCIQVENQNHDIKKEHKIKTELYILIRFCHYYCAAINKKPLKMYLNIPFQLCLFILKLSMLAQDYSENEMSNNHYFKKAEQTFHDNILITI